jgi:hypothetical protein
MRDNSPHSCAAHSSWHCNSPPSSKPGDSTTRIHPQAHNNKYSKVTHASRCLRAHKENCCTLRGAGPTGPTHAHQPAHDWTRTVPQPTDRACSGCACRHMCRHNTTAPLLGGGNLSMHLNQQGHWWWAKGYQEGAKGPQTAHGPCTTLPSTPTTLATTATNSNSLQTPLMTAPSIHPSRLLTTSLRAHNRTFLHSADRGEKPQRVTCVVSSRPLPCRQTAKGGRSAHRRPCNTKCRSKQAAGGSQPVGVVGKAKKDTRPSVGDRIMVCVLCCAVLCTCQEATRGMQEAPRIGGTTSDTGQHVPRSTHFVCPTRALYWKTAAQVRRKTHTQSATTHTRAHTRKPPQSKEP